MEGSSRVAWARREINGVETLSNPVNHASQTFKASYTYSILKNNMVHIFLFVLFVQETFLPQKIGLQLHFNIKIFSENSFF